MPDYEGVEHVISAAQEAVAPKAIGWEEDRFYVVLDRDGHLHVVDLDAHRAASAVADAPIRKTGTATVRDAPSFVAYVRKHGDDDTEVWADEINRTVTAVLDAHQGADSSPRWGQHMVKLRLETTTAWRKWTENNSAWLTQTDFAELIEERSTDFSSDGGHYSAADMLELAQTFKASSTSQFESSQRLKTGETQLVYLEDTTATAGARGDLAIPDEFRLVVQPFVGGVPYAVYCRMRYRIDRSTKQLKLGYVIQRPEDVLAEAFGSYVDDIRGVQPDGTVTADAGITQPVWRGSPIG